MMSGKLVVTVTGTPSMEASRRWSSWPTRTLRPGVPSRVSDSKLGNARQVNCAPSAAAAARAPNRSRVVKKGP